MARTNSRFLLVGALALLPVMPGMSAAQGGRAAVIQMRQKQAAQLEARPTPRLASGHPDLNGNWTFQDEVWAFVHPKIDSKGNICFVNCDPAPPAPAATAAAGKGNAGGAAPRPNFPDYKVQYQSEVQTLRKNIVAADPVLHHCANPGLPRIGPPSYIMQTGRMVVFLYASVDGNYWRVIPLEGAPHNADADPSPLGDSVGKWEGDTLVVEAVNFTPETWLTDYGAFHSADLRVVERFTRKGDAILYQVSSYDPAILAEPWTQSHLLIPEHGKLQPSPECIERDMSKMVNDAYHANPP